MLIYDDGIELNAVLEAPEDHDGHRLVILLHGFTSSKDRPHNIRAAAAMRDAGFATLRFDLYGHGESGGEFRKHTLFKWISNTMAVIGWARKQGFDELYLSGHSQGGLVAALVAGMEADRINGLILRAPAFMIPQCARDGNVLGQQFDPEHIPDVTGTIKGLELDGDYLRVAQMIHVEDAIDRFKRPVLILHGDRDDTVPLKESQKYSERYENCRLIVLPGETHHFDQHPDRAENLIRGWLNGLPDSAGSADEKDACGMKIGILSDTHDLLRPEVIKHLKGCNAILHGGDISSQRILDRLEQIAPVKAVRGNNDKDWAERLPLFLDFKLGGLRFFMTHKKKDLPEDLAPYDLVIYGHSHQYANAWQESAGSHRTLMLNPGSCGPRRFAQPITMAILTIDEDGWIVKQINIPHSAKEKAPEIDGGNIHQQIEIVVRDTQKGLSVDSIAQKRRLDPELVEQIVRLYVTHPGVTVDGIMTKMSLLGKL